MRNLLGSVLIIYFIMCLVNWNDPEPVPIPEPTIKAWNNPEPGREVDHFDEDSLRYIYADEMPKQTGKFHYKRPPLPDQYVIVIQQSGTGDVTYVSRKPRSTRVVQDELRVNGKRYRVYHKADHTQQLIEIR